VKNVSDESVAINKRSLAHLFYNYIDNTTDEDTDSDSTPPPRKKRKIGISDSSNSESD